MKIKVFFTLISLVLVIRTMGIILANPTMLIDHIIISATDAKGKIKYQVENLPSGVTLTQNKIQISNQVQIIEGEYLILIRAIDQQQNIHQKYFILHLIHKNEQKLTERIKQSADIKKQNNKLVIQKSMNLKKKIGFKPRLLTQKAGSFILNSTTPQAKTTILKEQRKNVSNLQLDNVISIKQQSYNKKNQQTSVNSKYPAILTNNKISSLSLMSSNPLTAQLIVTSQAPISSVPLRPSTQDSIRTTQAFKRQVSATRAVANLFSIIKKTTSDRNAAFIEMKNFETLYKKNTQSRLRINITLSKLKLDFNQNQIKLNFTIKQKKYLQQKIQNLSFQLKSKQKKHKQTASQIYLTQDKLSTLQSQLQIIKQQYNQIEKNRKNKQIQCLKYNQQLSIIYQKRQQKIDSLINIKIQLIPTQSKLKITKQNYQKLKAKLIKFEQQIKQQQLIVQNCNNQKVLLQHDLQVLQTRLGEIKNSTDQCTNQLEIYNTKIGNITQNKLNQLLDDKQSKQNEIKEKSQLLANLNLNINEIPNNIKEMNQKFQYDKKLIMNLTKQLAQKRLQIVDFTNFYDDANNDVIKAKTKFIAAQQRYLKLTQAVEQAKRNIELARTQKQAADLQVTVRLQQGARILPFPKVQPSQNSTITQITTNPKNKLNQKLQTNINKTSNAAAIKRVERQTLTLLQSGGIKVIIPNLNGTYSIKNIQQFVLAFFGPTITPPSLPISEIYPLKGQLKPSNLKIAQNITLQQKSLDGMIISVQQSSFSLLTNERKQIYLVEYNTNMRAFASNPDVFLSAGYKSIVKGLIFKKDLDKYMVANLIFCFP